MSHFGTYASAAGAGSRRSTGDDAVHRRGATAPAYEFDKLPATATDGEIILALALARDWPPGRKYESEIEAAIAGCLSVASRPSVQVQDLPPRPTPIAPQAALQPIPLASYFLTRWGEIFRP